MQAVIDRLGVEVKGQVTQDRTYKSRASLRGGSLAVGGRAPGCLLRKYTVLQEGWKKP